MRERVGFIGAGRAGATLAAALVRAGYRLQGVVNSTWESTECVAAYLETTAYRDAAALVRECDVVFLGVPDRAIAGVCRELSQQGLWQPHHVVAHLSGAEDHHLLDSAGDGGARTMSFHPLCSFAQRERTRSLHRVHFAVEGDSAAVALAENMVQALGGDLLAIPAGGKILYHVAAVVASNYLVGLAHLSSHFLTQIGIERERALRALLPLIQGTVDNLQEVGLPHALTGPVARGDVATVAGHLTDLAALHDEEESESLYRALGYYTTTVAEEAGLPRGTAEDLRRMFEREERES